jgi:D-glycero-D-manno-heptose 1,7-bisphosphate phosphatase
MGRAAVFLDRDGTINKEVGYLSNPGGLVLIDGSGGAVRRINEAGFLAVLVTNQSGIARGYFTEAVLETIHARLTAELEKTGARLDGIYVCPHHTEGTVASYTVDCGCRKPQTALVEKAARNLDIDLSASYMVGDHFKDIELARNSGMRSVLVLTGHGQEEWDAADEAMRSRPDYVAVNLAAAVEWLLANKAERTPQ